MKFWALDFKKLGSSNIRTSHFHVFFEMTANVSVTRQIAEFKVDTGEDVAVVPPVLYRQGILSY